MRNNSTPRPPVPGGPTPSRPRGQEGFTLVEAVVATGILIVGLAAISNLMFVAISSNSVANWQTGSAFLASQKLEELRSTTFTSLVDSPADSLTVDQPAYNENTVVNGLGTFHTRWRIQTVAAVSPNLKYIAVLTEMNGPLGRLTRAEFTTLRASR